MLCGVVPEHRNDFYVFCWAGHTLWRRSCRWCSIGQPRFLCLLLYIWETAHYDAVQGRAVHMCEAAQVYVQGMCMCGYTAVIEHQEWKELCMLLDTSIIWKAVSWMGWLKLVSSHAQVLVLKFACKLQFILRYLTYYTKTEANTGNEVKEGHMFIFYVTLEKELMFT